MNLTKKDFIDSVAEMNGITKAVAEKVISSFLEEIAGCLKLGDEITLHGFGKFITRISPARVGWNPSTGDILNIPAKRKVSFKPQKALKDAIQ